MQISVDLEFIALSDDHLRPRVSTDGQSVAAHVADLRAAGAAKVYSETISGAATNRAELAKVLRVLPPGDVLMVTRLDRPARSRRDLLNTLHALAEREVGFKSLVDTWGQHHDAAAGGARSPGCRRDPG